MQKKFPYPIKYKKVGMIFVKTEGVKLLHENYFRKDYLKNCKNINGYYRLEKIFKYTNQCKLKYGIIYMN